MSPQSADAHSTAPLDIQAILKRMPAESGAGLSLAVLGLLSGNGLALYYLVRGEMTALELVLLVALEALVLSLIARLQLLTVPRSARPPEPEGQGNKLGTLVFGLGWLAVTYYAVFWMYFGSGEEVRAAWSAPWELIMQPQILLPLAITLAFAVMDALQDHQHFRSHGGQFVGTPGFSGLARLMTLFFGAIPFVIPLLVLVAGIVAAVRFAVVAEGAAQRPGKARLFVVVLGLNLGLTGALALTVVGLFQLGVAGWAIGFVSAKIASEAMVLAMPFIFSRMHAESVAAELEASAVHAES